MLLKSRFKNTKDLWLFMTERRKWINFLHWKFSHPLILSWKLKLADSSNSYHSRYTSPSPENDSPPVSAGHHGKEKEGPAYERRACAQGAIVALTCYQVDLSSDRQDVSRYPWVFAWIRRQTRRPFSRSRLLLQSSQRLAPWASWLADNWSCSCACSEGAELVGGAVETFHLRWMDG